MVSRPLDGLELRDDGDPKVLYVLGLRDWCTTHDKVSAALNVRYARNSPFGANLIMLSTRLVDSQRLMF